ncbi:AraC family transcriptional regulator [Tumebacillus avium]|uniref:AraC family transcriptional regulator n=1 Tax=Tumebacillus avium TaxID=1903704 RepID=A0A1Y0IJV8_9BACL|nr:AraC family transcriptional regulator [Tumebacillus avium]ARU60369.1 AraC family transcriptional regulator [Tumebacillus avium]
MDWQKRLEDALEFIESNLEASLPVETIAKAVYSSPFHFQRMFHIWSGITLGEYVRKRKLTLAAQELAGSSVKVVDVAFKYGYESPEAFCKAFRKLHGVSPSEARKPGVAIKAFPRVSFEPHTLGDGEVEYRIVERDAFTVVGTSAQLSCGSEGRTRQWFWGASRGDGTFAKLSALETDTPLLGITMNFEEEFTYMIAREADAAALADVLFLQTIPASTWAVFPCAGPIPEAIQNGLRNIYKLWFPATEFEHAGLPELEVYLPGDAQAEDYRCEAWIPIVKKTVI